MTLQRSLACLAVLAFAALAAVPAVPGPGRTFHLGAVTLGFAQTARLHVVNPEGGSVDVVLRFADAADVTLASATATLLPGQTKTLDLPAADAPGGLVQATVVAMNAVSPSACEPVVTLQVLDGLGLRHLRSGSHASAVPVGRPLGGGEPAAVSALRTLAQAQRQFFEAARATKGRGVYSESVEELIQAGLLPQGFAVPGYDLKLGTGLYLYEITATPKTSGDRYFFVDESGVVRFTIDHCQDPVGSRPIGG